MVFFMTLAILNQLYQAVRSGLKPDFFFQTGRQSARCSGNMYWAIYVFASKIRANISWSRGHRVTVRPHEAIPVV